MSDPVRPRFGQLSRRNGDTVALVFHETDTPGQFQGLCAGDETEVVIYPGGQLSVDVIGPGQSITLSSCVELE